MFKTQDDQAFKDTASLHLNRCMQLAADWPQSESLYIHDTLVEKILFFIYSAARITLCPISVFKV